jgi:hypothetical protein
MISKFAMQKLRDVVKDLEWDSNKTHGYWIDCDENLVVENNFNRTIVNDLYDECLYRSNEVY